MNVLIKQHNAKRTQITNVGKDVEKRESHTTICRQQCCDNESCSVVSDSLQPHGLYSLWNSPGQNTGVGSLSLLQGIFLTHAKVACIGQIFDFLEDV